MTFNQSRIFQFFKYAVYSLLAINVYVFFAEEHAAAALQFADGIRLGQLIEAYPSAIDTAAWLILLLMFELETYVLDDDTTSTPTVRLLQVTRAVCYAIIVYAFYGYITNLMFHLDATPAEAVTNLCALGNGWSYAIDLDEYAAITAETCRSFSSATAFFQLPGVPAVVDADGLNAITALAWVDVINAAVWLLVVVSLEVEVALQERGRNEGAILTTNTVLKVVLYAILLMAAIFWGMKGDFVDFWDAFLWLVAFVFIELNVFDWRQEASASA
ncbi:MAG: hypothetical protein AAF351_07870 [Pseudomonadota bacterium]